MSKQKFLQRKLRVRAKISGSENRPRLSVFRSSKHIYAQVINDAKGVTLVSFSDQKLKKIEGAKTTSEIASLVGEEIAKSSLKEKIKKIVFDKGAYKYHGRVKSLAEGARKGGLEF